MAVHSDTFGGVRLTGDDAAKFRNQVRYGRLSKAARDTAARGRAMVFDLLSNGVVRVTGEAL
jgi:hypothetical protein